MDEDKRPIFVVSFRAEKDCADPVKALRVVETCVALTGPEMH